VAKISFSRKYFFILKGKDKENKGPHDWNGA
jgi:hypothetical protein